MTVSFYILFDTIDSLLFTVQQASATCPSKLILMIWMHIMHWQLGLHL